jgi:hypothetical protein
MNTTVGSYREWLDLKMFLYILHFQEKIGTSMFKNLSLLAELAY